MPRIFGQEVSGKTALIVGGVAIAAVALIVYLRSKGSSAEAPLAAPQPQDDTGGGGGGMSIPVGSQGTADAYNQALQNQQVAAGAFALKQGEEQLREQVKMFDLQQTVDTARAQNDINTYKRQAALKIACPKHTYAAKYPDGTTYCADKKSGTAATNFVRNAGEGIADQGYKIGQQVANIGADYLMQHLLPSPKQGPTRQAGKVVPTGYAGKV